MSVVFLGYQLVLIWSGTGRISMIFWFGSSRPDSLQDIVLFQIPVRRQYIRAGSLISARLLLWKSPRTNWYSWWGSWAASPRYRVRGVSNFLPPCLWRRCRRSSSRGTVSASLLSLWRTPCTIFQHGEVGVVKGWYKLIIQGSVDGSAIVVHTSLFHVFAEDTIILPGWCPCWDVCHSSRARWVHKGGAGDAQAEGWAWGSCSGLRRGRSQLMPRLLSVVGVTPWWRRNPACPCTWGLRG